MAQARGSNSLLLMDWEDTFGSTPGTVDGRILPFVTHDLKGEREESTSAVINGSRNPVRPNIGQVSVGGTATVPLDQRAIGHWLKGLLGAPVTTGAGPYTHTYKIGSASLPSMYVEKQFPDVPSIMGLNGIKVDSFSVTLGVDASDLTAEVGCVGTVEDILVSSEDATPTTITLDKFENFQGLLKINGSNYVCATEVSFEIKNNLETDNYCIGTGGTLSSIPEGKVEITGNMRLVFDSEALLQDAIDATEKSLEVVFTSGASSLSFLFPEVLLGQNTPGVDGPGGILLDVPFTAYYQNAAQASAVVVTLVNDQAAAAYT